MRIPPLMCVLRVRILSFLTPKNSIGRLGFFYRCESLLISFNKNNQFYVVKSGLELFINTSDCKTDYLRIFIRCLFYNETFFTNEFRRKQRIDTSFFPIL